MCNPTFVILQTKWRRGILPRSLLRFTRIFHQRLRQRSRSLLDLSRRPDHDDCQIAPYLTTLINGAGWQNGFPRVITNADMEGLIQQSGGKPKLVAIQDVTCDIRVGLSHRVIVYSLKELFARAISSLWIDMLVSIIPILKVLRVYSSVPSTSYPQS